MWMFQRLVASCLVKIFSAERLFDGDHHLTLVYLEILTQTRHSMLALADTIQGRANPCNKSNATMSLCSPDGFLTKENTLSRAPGIVMTYHTRGKLYCFI
jgi:hypothetical protein